MSSAGLSIAACSLKFGSAAPLSALGREGTVELQLSQPTAGRFWCWKGPVRWLALAVLWATCVSIGGALLWKYAATPGVAATPPENWPTHSAIARKPNTATIIMLAHPRCPCTRASIAELAVLMNRVGERARAHVLFTRPSAAEAGWEKTDLFQSAAGIPGVTAHSDPGGAEAALFGAATSGQALVYDAAGVLRFSGGITASRGHEGDNLGLSSIISLVTGGHADQQGSKVFGCELASSAETKGKAGP